MDELAIEPREVHDMMEKGVKFFLLDCREPWEYQTARIEGATLIPMRQIPQKLDAIPKDQPVVVYCHAGVRSFNAAVLAETTGSKRAQHERRHRSMVKRDRYQGAEILKETFQSTSSYSAKIKTGREDTAMPKLKMYLKPT